MAMIGASAKFHGTVLDLLGKELAEVRGQLPPFDLIAVDGGGGIERVTWSEALVNSESGETVLVRLILRVRNGVIERLAIQADRYVFRVRSRPGAKPWLVASPKARGCDQTQANWIGERGGKLVNRGVE
jgi:hypothetical protein